MPITHTDVEALEVSGERVTVHCWARDNDYFHPDPVKRNTYRFDRRVVVREVRVDPALAQLYDAEEILKSLRDLGRVRLRRGGFRPDLLFDYEYGGDTVYISLSIVPPGQTGGQGGGESASPFA